MRRSPTSPLYETNKIELPDSEHAGWVIAAINFLKMTNQKKMFGWDRNRELEAINSLKDVSEDDLSQAYNELKSLVKMQLCDFGDYFRLANSIALRGKESKGSTFRPESDPNDWRERELHLYVQHQEREVDAPKEGKKAIKGYWMEHIRADLAKGLTKQLPYDKNVKTMDRY